MVKNLGQLVQPLLIVILGGIVLFIILAVFLPYHPDAHQRWRAADKWAIFAAIANAARNQMEIGSCHCAIIFSRRCLRNEPGSRSTPGGPTRSPTQLNEPLPRRFFAEVQTHLGSQVEADVVEFERLDRSGFDEPPDNGAGGGVAVQTWAPRSRR